MSITMAITAAAGALLSLAFKLIPPLAKWFEKQSAENKEALNLWLVIVIATVTFGLASAGMLTNVGIAPPDQSTWFVWIVDLLGAIGVGLGSNQGTHKATGRWG